MPRSLASMMGAIAWVGVTLGLFLAALRWYEGLNEWDRGPVDVAGFILLVVGGIFALLLSPFLVADWVVDWRREAHLRWLQRQGGDRR